MSVTWSVLATSNFAGNLILEQVKDRFTHRVFHAEFDSP